MTSTVRAAVEADVPEILDLIQELAVYEKEPDAVRNTVETLRGQLFAPHPAVFAHVVDAPAGSARRIDGVALWFLSYSTWEGTHGIYLEDLYVRADARGTGSGKALLKSLADIAVARGYARVEWAVLKWNEPSIKFYKSLGATALDAWDTYRLTGPALSALGDATAALEETK